MASGPAWLGRGVHGLKLEMGVVGPYGGEDAGGEVCLRAQIAQHAG